MFHKYFNLIAPCVCVVSLVLIMCTLRPKTAFHFRLQISYILPITISSEICRLQRPVQRPVKSADYNDRWNLPITTTSEICRLQRPVKSADSNDQWNLSLKSLFRNDKNINWHKMPITKSHDIPPLQGHVLWYRVHPHIQCKNYYYL